MQDEPVVGILEELLGNHLQQLLLHRQRGLSLCQSGAVGDAEDVGVHRHGGLAEGGVEHHVGGLASHAGQGFEIPAVVRHLAAELLDEDAAGLDDVLRLVVEQADGLDVLLQPLFAQFEDGLGRVGHGEEPFGGFVHAHVGGLRREDDGDEQFEGRAVLQLGGGVGVGVPQPFEDLAALLRIHGVVRVKCLSAGWAR